MATTLGVPAATISLTISSASVILKFTVAVASVADAEAVKSTATQQLGTKTAASNALGVTVIEDPVASASFEAAPTIESTASAQEAAADGEGLPAWGIVLIVVFVVLFGILLCAFGVVIYREKMGKPVFVSLHELEVAKDGKQAPQNVQKEDKV